MSPRPRLRTLMSTELDVLRDTADRTDPLDETVLCVLEAAVRVLDAADLHRAGAGPVQVHECLREALAAARATVTAATFAVVRAEDTEREDRSAGAVIRVDVAPGAGADGAAALRAALPPAPQNA